MRRPWQLVGSGRGGERRDVYGNRWEELKRDGGPELLTRPRMIRQQGTGRRRRRLARDGHDVISDHGACVTAGQPRVMCHDPAPTWHPASLSPGETPQEPRVRGLVAYTAAPERCRAEYQS